MESRQVVSAPKGRIVGDVALALLIGTLLPIVAVLQVSMLLPVLMLCGLFSVWLKARTGWVSALTLITATLASSAFFLGMTLTLAMAAAAVLPALWVMRGVALKQPFFDQLRGGIAAFGLGLVVALGIAYVSFGGSMVARFTDLLRAEFARMPDSALQPIVDAMNSAFTISGVRLAGEYTVELYRAQLTGVFDLMQQTYARMLPGALLSGALLSGVLSVLWGNWTMARQGMATNESFQGMSRWFLPGQISLGALALLAISFILTASGYSAGATVFQTVTQLVGAIFVIQAMASMDRRMLRAGRTLTRRRVLLAITAVGSLLMREFALVFAVVGVLSALFGSRGALKRLTGGEEDDQSDRHDPQE